MHDIGTTQNLFSRKCRTIENIPSTQATLGGQDNIYREVYQGNMFGLGAAEGPSTIRPS